MQGLRKAKNVKRHNQYQSEEGAFAWNRQLRLGQLQWRERG